MKNERTSKRVASIAAKGMKKPESLTLDEIQSVSASANTQAADFMPGGCFLEETPIFTTLIRHFADGRAIPQPIRIGERVCLYGDETEIEIL